jgi:hypothetical protein
MTLLDLLELLVAALVLWFAHTPLLPTIVIVLAALCATRWLLGERIPRRPP